MNDPDPYIAHKLPDNSETQSVSSHNLGTAMIACERCPLLELIPIIELGGDFHDAGKYSEIFQEYIKQGEDSPLRRGDVNHATAGGLLINKLAPGSLLSEMLQIAIYSHHGLYDCINLSSGEALIEKRQSAEYQTREGISLDLVEERFYQYADRKEIAELFIRARSSLEKLSAGIMDFKKKDLKNQYGNRNFYLGMYERLLMSLLIDADRSNTANFMNVGQEVEKPDQWKEDIKKLWQSCITHLETHLSALKIRSKIDDYRKEISTACRDAAYIRQNLYRLTLPTGSGKTLSVLRFALHHAMEFKKQRILYVAPFNSILEQNAKVIRDALGQPEIVLEHHCNVIPETEEAQKKYDRLTENWLSPVVATTAVQFLNTLFSAKTGSVRRMHSLCNSIVIFDEIQALPVKTISLFNLAVNFLTTFCNTTVILCSATQPVFDKLPCNRLLPPKELIEDYIRYDKAFRRVTMFDRTGLNPGGLSIEELGSFVLEHFPSEQQMLVIVNTKSCARKLYDYLKKQNLPDQTLYHLSTNMCALHRRDVLDKVGERLEDEKNPKPVICISTQLIEAGVDLSFRCVIRSLAGLDNIIQAAGRCNRHGSQDNGNVYIVKMSPEAEKVSYLKDIKRAQEAMTYILERYGNDPGNFDYDLLSARAKEQYYFKYLQQQEAEVDFNVTVHGEPTTLVELFSQNKLVQARYRTCHPGQKSMPTLKQSFKTAGDLFEVISEAGKVNVVVEYNQEITNLIAELQSPYTLYARQKEILRELQMASVGISEQMKNKLGRAVEPVCGGLINVLSISYYSIETGVSEEPVGMKLLNY